MKLIDKDTLVAEIERRIESCAKQREDMLNVQYHTLADDASARMGELNCIKDFLATLEVKEVGVDFGDLKGDKCAKYIIDTKTLEVKEVDLNSEIKSWLDNGDITDTRYDDYDDRDIERTAKHFFELGIKARKGE